METFVLTVHVTNVQTHQFKSFIASLELEIKYGKLIGFSHE
jgi:hypothetical protein